jgi:hypothetical protein
MDRLLRHRPYPPPPHCLRHRLHRRLKNPTPVGASLGCSLVLLCALSTRLSVSLFSEFFHFLFQWKPYFCFIFPLTLFVLTCDFVAEKGSVYNKKGRVEDIVSPFEFTVVMDDTQQLIESTTSSVLSILI